MAYGPTETIRGTLADIEASVARAMEMPRGGTFIAQLLYETDLFVQFTCAGEDVGFAFPLITPRQKQYEQAIRDAAQALSLDLKQERTDLLVEMIAKPRDVAHVTREFLRRIYNVTPATPLDIQSF